MNGKRELSILLVEDNQADAELVCEILREKIACAVAVASDGEQALAHMRAGRGKGMPDLVLLDLNLPKLSGREVLRAVKQDPDLRRVPVLVFTSSGADRDITDCYDLNANCYIQKPTGLENFSRLVDNLNSFWIKQVKLPSRDGRGKNG